MAEEFDITVEELECVEGYSIADPLDDEPIVPGDIDEV